MVKSAPHRNSIIYWSKLITTQTHLGNFSLLALIEKYLKYLMEAWCLFQKEKDCYKGLQLCKYFNMFTFVRHVIGYLLIHIFIHSV